MKYNQNQELAIFTKDKDILVSAGAGSGKTFVMIERIAENIIKHNVSVDELLVVTFTNAAANEMRLKLNDKLLELLNDDNLDSNERKYLLNQVDLMGQSDICTLHKFCQTLIQKYFYTIDIDSAFAIGEESDTLSLKNRAINNLITELAEKKDANFLLLANTFDDKRGFDKIKKYAFKIYDFLTNQPSIDDFKNRVNNAYLGTIDTNAYTDVINKYVCEVFDYFTQSFADLKREADFLGFDALSEKLSEYITELSKISTKNTFSQNHYLVFNLNLSTLSVRTDDAECLELKEDASALKTSFSKVLAKLRDNVYLSSDLNEISKDLQASKNVVFAMFNLVEKFTKKYSKLKKDNNILDFSDLEHYAYQILCNPQVQAEVCEKYKQIYVDEYQDINDIQEGIINKIHQIKDLFLVGDVKQSIYGFRNTNPQIFLDKQTKFADSSLESAISLPLNENYRTDQKILDVVNLVFGVLMTKRLGGIDYLPDNKMVSGREFKSSQNSLPSVEVLIVEQEKEEKQQIIPTESYKVSTAPILEDEEKSYAKTEANIIFSKIAQLLHEQKQIYDAKSGKFRDIRLDDITLLARTRSDYLDILLKELTDLGLPLAPIERETVFGEYEVNLLYTYLYLVNNKTDDIKLTEFLISPIINLNEDELSRIRLNSPESETFYDCIINYNIYDNIGDKLKRALTLIEDGRLFLVNKTIYELLVDFCDKTNYLEIISAFDGGQNRVRNVQGYINSFIGKRFNSDLCEYIASVEENDSMPKITPENNTGISVVGVETMHHSKGLEYPIVFLVDTGHGFNMEEMRGDFLLHSELGVGMYVYDTEMRVKKETVSHSAIKIALNNKRFAENLRLLYVAMTRAKNHLFITGSTNLDKIASSTLPYALKITNNNMNLILSVLNKDEIDKLKNIKHLTHKINDENLINFEVFPCEKSIKIDENKENNFNVEQDDEFCDILTKNCDFVYNFDKNTKTALKNTVTMLNRQDEDPEISQNYEPKNFNVSENFSGQTGKVDTEVGIAYHKAMQLIDFDLASVMEVTNFLQTKLSIEEFNLIDCGKIYSAIQNLKPFVDGARLFREQEFLMYVPLKELTNSSIDDKVLVQGVVDLIAVKNNEIYIFDYKTSNTKNVEQRAKSYFTQMRCYQKAVEGALNCKINKKFLYFFLQERLILIDNE